MGDVVNIFKPVSTKKKLLTKQQLKSMEWLVLSTFQLELENPYKLLASYFVGVGLLEVFYSIIDRMETTEEGIYFLVPLHQ